MAIRKLKDTLGRPRIAGSLMTLELAYLSYGCDLTQRSALFLFAHGLLLVLLVLWLGRGIQAVGSGRVRTEPVTWKGVVLLAALLPLRVLVPYWAHPWPTGDEALQAFLGIHLSEHWTWHFFYTVGEHPPLSVWTYSFLAPFVPSARWIYALVDGSISWSILLSGWLAARVWFSTRTTGIFLFLLAFSFWPVFYGEFFIQGALIPFLEGMILWASGTFYRSHDVKTKRWAALAWGAFTGFGFFTYASWIAVGTASGAVFLWFYVRERKKDPAILVSFLIPALLTMGPFLWAWIHEGMGSHLRDIAMSNAQFSWGQKIKNALSYWSALVMGDLNANGSYAPFWGGFLNPLLGVAFFTGIIAFLKGPTRLGGWVLGCFLIWAMVPGMVTSDYPCLYRIVQAMPVVLLFCAFGVQTWWEKVGPNRRWVLGPFLVLSLMLDGFHFITANGLDLRLRLRPDTPIQNVNREAFRVLRAKSLQEGPGLIFSDLLLLSRNHSLSVETYPFNAALNPRFDPAQAHWAALLVNRHLEEPLSKRFRKVQWIPLSGGALEEDGGISLGLVPVEGPTFASLKEWLSAHRFFHERQFEAESILNDPVLYRKACDDLVLGYPLVEGDPFLESLYGEWVAQYHFAGGLDTNLQALHRALEKGYPTANLYLKYGNFLFLSGRKAEAMKAYSLAVQSRPNYTDAQAILDYLRNSR